MEAIKAVLAELSVLLFKPNFEKVITRKDIKRLKKILAKPYDTLDVEWPLICYGFAATPSLIECLDDDKIADRVVELLIDISRHEYDKDSDSCINPVLPLIVRALHHENEHIRSRSAQILTQMPGLMCAKTAKLTKAAKGLISSLERQTDPVPVLIDKLESREHMPKRRGAMNEMGDFRRWIVSILGGFGPENRIVSALTRSLLEDKDKSVYYAICKVLKEFGPVSGSIPSLIEALRFSTQEDIVLAAETLGSYGEAARKDVPHLIRAYSKCYGGNDQDMILSVLQGITGEAITWMEGEELNRWFKRNSEEFSNRS